MFDGSTCCVAHPQQPRGGGRGRIMAVGRRAGATAEEQQHQADEPHRSSWEGEPARNDEQRNRTPLVPYEYHLAPSPSQPNGCRAAPEKGAVPLLERKKLFRR